MIYYIDYSLKIKSSENKDKVEKEYQIFERELDAYKALEIILKDRIVSITDNYKKYLDDFEDISKEYIENLNTYRTIGKILGECSSREPNMCNKRFL